MIKFGMNSGNVQASYHVTYLHWEPKLNMHFIRLSSSCDIEAWYETTVGEGGGTVLQSTVTLFGSRILCYPFFVLFAPLELLLILVILVKNVPHVYVWH